MTGTTVECEPVGLSLVCEGSELGVQGLPEGAAVVCVAVPLRVAALFEQCGVSEE